LPANRAVLDADQREAHHSGVLPCVPTTADSPCFHPPSRGICHHPRGSLAFLILERVLPSQHRTLTSLSPATLVLPRPRSHPNSAICCKTFCLTRLRVAAQSAWRCYCAVARTLRRSPTIDAVKFLISVPPLQSPASSHSCRRVAPTVNPNVLDPCPAHGARVCNALLAPASSVDRCRLLC
jgi:hypothetical protein